MIYLDNAATTRQKPECVIRAVTEALTSMGNVGRGVNESSLSAARTVYEARRKLCALFGGEDPSRLCFASNATEALNTALFGLLAPGDHVITTDMEHNSVLRPLYRLEKAGTELSFLPADRTGRLDLSDMEGYLRPHTRALVCTHASNLTGEVNDIDRLGAFAKEHDLLFILDASQTAGSLSIDMKRSHIDVVCFTGHKGLMGPQGTGGLCIAPGVDIRPLKTGGTGVHSYDTEQPTEYPTHLEAGTLNAHGIAGLSAAVDYLNEVGLETIHARETALMRRFYEQVFPLPGVTVYGDFSRDRAPIVALNIRDTDSAEVSDILTSEYDIAVRSGAHCAPRMHAALGTTAQGAVRFSFGYFNTEEEIDAAAEAVRSIADE